MVHAEHVWRQVAAPGGLLTILADVSLHVPPGASQAVLGASGSGKSTLLALLAGLDLPERGSIHLDGADLIAMNEDQRAQFRCGRVGFVFQAFHLLHSLTALENVVLPLELAGFADAGSRARALMQDVGLALRCHHYPRQLSGGEQQRVALARAFAGEPRVLFADEPTGNLDRATGAKVADLLFDLRDSHGTTLVLVTHDTALARRCEARTELDDGRTTAESTP